MDCTHCGATAQPGQRFCGQCGRPLAVHCQECGQENPPDHRFCGGCGTSLTPTAPAAVADRPAATERRVVSVLFVDLVGFTTYAQHRDPEDVRNLITRYFDVAREVIERFGGTIDKYIGDAVMAWWGATSSREDDAERAVRAGLELVDRVASMGEHLGLADLAARAGVMTGEVSVGPGGNEKGLLLGDLVNSTSRLQSVAEPGSVFVGETTASLVERAIELAPAGVHQVKGKDEPLVASRAVRVVSERGGRGRADVLEPPFVGRVSELRLLKDTLHAVGRDRRARLVSLVGQAGIGKSRLIWEFQKYVDGLVEDIFWHEGRSPAYGEGLALWALGEMIRRRAGIQETDDDATTATRLDETVKAHVEDPDVAEWVRERLSGLLGLGDSVGSERTELFAAARAFFEGISRQGSTVLVFEDLHWADPSLLEFIEELPDWSQNHPILVVTMARPDLLDRRPDWGSARRGFTSIYLAPLAEIEMEELIRGAVPGIPEAALAKITAAAGGVPLFAVEMLRMLLADGRLVVDEGGVRVARPLEELEVPSSVQAVISARLDRLPSIERDLARDAAVLGQSFTVEGLAALREEEVDKLERRLGDLVRHEILELNRDPRSPERGQYRWVQSMLREVAYSRISRADRHQLHLQVARYFRSLDDPELAPIMASHFLAASENAMGEDPALEAELIESLGAAIDRARALHAHEQLRTLVDTALSAGVPPDLEAELREVGARAAVRLNDLDVADRHVEALLQMAKAADDLPLLHRAVALAGFVGNATRRGDRATEALEQHLQTHSDFTSDANLARAAVYLARAKLLMGKEAEAATIAHEALGAVERLRLIDEVADAMVTQGTALARERIHQGMALLRGALQVCREHGLVETKLRALINIGYATTDPSEGRAVSLEAFEEAKRVGDRNSATFVAGNLLGGYSQSLQLDAIEALLADPVLTDSPADQVYRLVYRAELAVRRGDLAGGKALLDEARQIGEAISDPQTRLHLERAATVIPTQSLDGRPAFEVGRRHYRESPFIPVVSVAVAMTGAAIEGDAQMLQEVEEMAATLAEGSLSHALTEWCGAMLSLVRGDVERAVERIEILVPSMRQQEMLWDAFLVLATVARHLPRGHEARSRFIAEAGEIAREANANGLVDWLERLTA